MIIKWRVSFWNIQKVECEKETEHFVWVIAHPYILGESGTKVVKRAKKSEEEEYFDSFAAARESLIIRQMADIEEMEKELSCAKNCLEHYKSLNEDKFQVNPIGANETALEVCKKMSFKYTI